MKNINILLLAFVVGCSSHTHKAEKPHGEYKWHYRNPDKKELSKSDLENELLMSTNACKIEALKIVAPSPSCTSSPGYLQSCSGLVGFARGMCDASNSRALGRIKCDSSATDEARSNQKQIYTSCMILRGWESVWVPDETDNKTKEQLKKSAN